MIANQPFRSQLLASSGILNLFRSAVVVFAVLAAMAIAAGQQAPELHPGDPNARLIEGVNNTTVFGMGQSIRITGRVDGAIAFGGDVIIEGSVNGDVAAIGGSVIQGEGSHVSGDVIVVGGFYQHGKQAPDRDPKSVTIMYAGYENELRHVMREPFSLLQPRLTAAFFGSRLLAMLIWFIIALAVTAALPNTVSRAVTRIQLTSLRVALIGFLGSVAVTLGVFLCLWSLPRALGVVVSIIAILFVAVSWVFGRVAISVATGHWLQRRLFPRAQTQSVKLLLGIIFWAVLLSVPYIWPIIASGLLVVSLGLSLTARYRLTWKRVEASRAL
jgi:hypothetical protein